MPRGSLTHALVAEVASAQSGLITAAQLRTIGMPPSTVTHRLRDGGMWTRVLPGVHLVTGGSPDRSQREVAALLYCGEGAVLTGLTALRRDGIRAGRLQETDDDRLRPEPVFVLVPHERRRLSAAYVRVERTRSLPSASDCRLVDGLLLAPPARAIADAARRMRDLPDVTAVVSECVRRGLVGLDDLREELARGSIRGSGHLRAALNHAAAGVWSAPEGDLRTLLASTRLPEPQWNVVVVDARGQYLARPDAWFDDVALALEVDSREHHFDDDAWERTLARQRRYARAGVVVLPITPRSLRESPDLVAREVLHAYQSASRRTRPPVHVAALGSVPRGAREHRWAG